MGIAIQDNVVIGHYKEEAVVLVETGELFLFPGDRNETPVGTTLSTNKYFIPIIKKSKRDQDEILKIYHDI
ncbi:hypothetical protein M2454_000779 [Aequitasia blattaphilus]|uniref:DUF3006 domain-containing protein n=1 Tax=Aequitasia blattaphilus TaxID=2949332 RepID=A0ABT1E833_9FIRM|nr:hypothetical protein [Aequitasia blattaphilus]MCP1101986.1 hypothetical protein [Aequitasia blattaphilus]MCR8614626.1 hypothetical protein [Aequitasia blattaphilus]